MEKVQSIISQVNGDISLGSVDLVLLPPPSLEKCYCKQDAVCAYDAMKRYQCWICHKKYILGEGLPLKGPNEKLFEGDQDYYNF